MNSNIVHEKSTLVLDGKPSPALGETSCAVLKFLESGEPRSTVQVALASGLPVKTVYHALYRLWYMGRLLRSSKPAGRVQLPDCGYSDRPDYRYLLRRDDENGRIVRGIQYVADAAVAHAFQNKPARNRYGPCSSFKHDQFSKHFHNHHGVPSEYQWLPR